MIRPIQKAQIEKTRSMSICPSEMLSLSSNQIATAGKLRPKNCPRRPKDLIIVPRICKLGGERRRHSQRKNVKGVVLSELSVILLIVECVLARSYL
jgi:hypothetical protein